MLKITFNDGIAQKALDQLMGAVLNTRPAFVEIGEELIEVSKQSFATSSSPSGQAWLPNRPSTIAAYMGQLSGNYKKDGSLSKNGAQRMASKKPLLGLTKDLSRQFSYVATDNGVVVSNSMVYAAMQHFGGSKAEFPNLWGDIPARPFMPMDSSGNADSVAQEIVLRIVRQHIESAL